MNPAYDIRTLIGLAAWISQNCRLCVQNQRGNCPWPQTVWLTECAGSCAGIGSGKAWEVGYHRFCHMPSAEIRVGAPPFLPDKCWHHVDRRGRHHDAVLPTLPQLKTPDPLNN